MSLKTLMILSVAFTAFFLGITYAERQKLPTIQPPSELEQIMRRALR